MKKALPKQNWLLGIMLFVLLNQYLSAQTNVYVNPDHVIINDFQGWGTSMAWWAEDAGDFHENNEPKIDELATILINDLNFTTFRYNIGGSCDEDDESNCTTINNGMNPQRTIPNMNQPDRGLNQRRMLKSIAKVGQVNGLQMKFETFSNSPPYWMLKSGSPSGGVNGENNLKDDQYDEFAEYLVRATGYINNDLAPYGFSVESIEPFNEPLQNWWRFNTSNNPGVQEGCSFSFENQYKMINALYDEMQAQGLTAFIAANDNFSMDSAVVTWYAQNGLMDKIGRLNFHDYSGTDADRKEIQSQGALYGKDVWISEGGLIGLNSPNAYGFQLLFMDRISRDLKYLRPKRWIDWQVMDTHASWTAIDYYGYMNNGNLIPNKRFYMMQHFTKHFYNGDDELFSSSNLGNVVAFRSADGTKLSVVIVNVSGSSQNYSVDLGDFTGTANATAEHWLTDKNANNHALTGNLSLDALGVLNVTMGPETIATFVVPITGGSASSCDATTLTPHYDINNDNINWASGTSITVDAGTPIKLAPQPNTGGDWTWSGAGTSGTSREQVITLASSAVATATFTNTCGKTSVLNFTITVNPVNCPETPITPYIYANGSWSQQNTVSVSPGDYVKFGPHPTSNVGNWSWSGCGITSNITTRELILYPETNCTVTATYTNACGTQTTLDFVIATTSTPSLSDGTYQIINRNSGKCLTSLNGATSNGTKVVQTTCDGSAGQEWTVTDTGSGIYTIVHKTSGLYADIQGQSTSAGAHNIIWPDNGGNNQRWNITDQGSGYFHIINVNSGLLLDIAGASNANNAQNIQWNANGGENQDWSFVLVQSSPLKISLSDFDLSKFDENHLSGFSFYPNPADNGTINLTVEDTFLNSQLSVYDMTGKVFFEKTVELNEEKLNLSHLSSGIYFISLNKGNERKTGKLIVGQ